MNWNLYFTILAQVSIGALAFVILAIPVGYGISHIVYGFIRPLPSSNDDSLIFRGGNDDQ